MSRAGILLACFSVTIVIQPEMLTGQTPQSAAWLEEEPLRPEADDAEYHKLLKEQHNTSLAILKLHFKQYQAGEIKVREVLDSASQVLNPREGIATSEVQGVQVREQYLGRYKGSGLNIAHLRL